MPFANKTTVTYKVYSLDVWGDEGEYAVNDRRRAGSVSVKTDRKNKSGWDVSNAALKKALVSGNYLNSRVRSLDVDGEDDGVLFVDSADGYPLLQLEYEKDHEEPSRGLFGEPGFGEPSTASKENPIEDEKNALGLTTGATIALAAAGAVVLGGIGYWFYSRSQAAASSAPGALPQAPAPVLPTPGVTDQQPAFVPGF